MKMRKHMQKQFGFILLLFSAGFMAGANTTSYWSSSWKWFQNMLTPARTEPSQNVAPSPQEIKADDFTTLATIEMQLKNAPESKRKSLEAEKYKIYTSWYNDAIKQTKIVDPQNISSQLWPIAPWNKNLQWNDDQQSYVAMTSWVPAAHIGTYKNALQNNALITISFESWVTPTPQLKNFVRDYKTRSIAGISLFDRITQHLGLNPSSIDPANPIQKKYFVELWIKPEDLFRPCIDKEILDTQCIPELKPDAIPDSFKRIMEEAYSCTNTTERTNGGIMPLSHKTWIQEKYKKQYPPEDLKNNWPWTRLGYTYDWGVNPKTKKHYTYGASEYVIKLGSKVFVRAIYTTDGYDINQ